MARIYTKTGDKGETSLFNGTRVLKNNGCIEGYGNIDELNSILGFCLTLLKDEKIRKIIFKIQNDLFQLGSDLATPIDSKNAKAVKFIRRIGDKEITQLEAWIDELDQGLPKLTSFILPGGGSAGASLHIARCVCRRSERWVTGLVKDKKTNPNALMYLNRLSDLFFVLARVVNQMDNQTETIWKPR